MNATTVMSILLEQYRDLDRKTVELYMRAEKTFEEFQAELRNKLEAGSKKLDELELATEGAKTASVLSKASTSE